MRGRKKKPSLIDSAALIWTFLSPGVTALRLFVEGLKH